MTADVTIRDTTKSVDFDVEFLGFFPGMDGARHAGFTATAKVNRKDWNLELERRPRDRWLAGR